MAAEEAKEEAKEEEAPEGLEMAHALTFLGYKYDERGNVWKRKGFSNIDTDSEGNLLRELPANIMQELKERRIEENLGKSPIINYSTITGSNSNFGL